MSFDGHINKFPNSSKLYKLEELKNVNAPSLVIGDILVFNGIDFVNTPLSSIIPTPQNGLSLTGSDVELGGTLLHDTSVDGDVNQFSLFYDQLKNFSLSSIDTYIYGSNSVTLESDSNVNLLSNENLSGAVAHNTDLRSIPDWDLVGDLSGRIYSGNDVLDLFSLLGGNIRGTGFFNKRTSNGVSHYLFAGDVTGTGGIPDNIALGLGDFSGENASYDVSLDTASGGHTISLTLDSALANANYSLSKNLGSKSIYENINDDTSGDYYQESINLAGQLNRTFANTGYTYQETADYYNAQISHFTDSSGFNNIGSITFDGANRRTVLRNSNNVNPEQAKLTLNYDTLSLEVSDQFAVINFFSITKNSASIAVIQPEVGGEKIVVRDSASGELRDSIAITGLEKKMFHSVTSGSYSASVGELIIYTGPNLGVFTHTLTLPSASNGDKVTVKVYSNDIYRIVGSGGDTIDGGAFLDVDGTISSKPSVDLIYDASLPSWVVV